ncbi:NADP-dependent 3-hydroxy acid dehydrogenase YdfG [Frondihabitans sp. PhB188]|uniref:SDR family NAD(P)-dependent oxidoreductase n=1 Tax=Frondihabitans sp. PhB188 TaxID=2485200 RepID=UPI000F49DD40|nr:SDR family NAD(P)-dependent oxidoreductase [Frondihabitans sp. PhB188]ROQ39496.1 NADP-dependent 3-hydroxy acid dehydrogenase YdfG [Frondihabitans sp. PhB188]
MTTTLITGANKGLGYETARRLIEAGHSVWIGARDAERGQKAADELGATFVQLDVTDQASVDAAAATVAAAGGLDVLVNNAGVTGPQSKPAAELTGADFEGVYAVNVFGIVRAIHAFLPLLQASANPTIVNVTSGLGSFDSVHDANRIESKVVAPIYNSSKSAVTMLTVQYARALDGIKVNAADPGYTATDLNGNSGHQTLTEGTDAIVTLATLPVGGPTGTFIDRSGPAAF